MSYTGTAVVGAALGALIAWVYNLAVSSLGWAAVPGRAWTRKAAPVRQKTDKGKPGADFLLRRLEESTALPRKPQPKKPRSRWISSSVSQTSLFFVLCSVFSRLQSLVQKDWWSIVEPIARKNAQVKCKPSQLLLSPLPFSFTFVGVLFHFQVAGVERNLL